MVRTARMIVKAADRLRAAGFEEFDFGTIGEFAFGKCGRTAINAAFVSELWLVRFSNSTNFYSSPKMMN